MEWIKKVWSALFLVAASYTGTAAPAIIGGELYYTHLGNGKYLATVNAYRDCAGNQLSFYPIAMTPDGGSTYYYGGTGPSGGWDITPVCRRSCTQCISSSCSFGFGIEKYMITDTFDLSGFSQCEILFSWTAGVRSSAITTGAASSKFYIEATLNRCAAGDHSSATFSQPPHFILEKAVCTGFYENGAGEVGDSLVYEQADPMTSAYTTAAYASGYGKEEPVRYSGYPTKTWKASTCEGIRFDKHTGRLDFKPTKNEISVFVFRIHHYRKDSQGTYKKSGTVMREYRADITNSSGNRHPIFSFTSGTAKENITICQDDTTDYVVIAYDSDIDDSVWLSGDSILPGATFTRKGKSGILKWTPDSSAVRAEPYEIILTAKDDACPMPGISQQRYLIHVRKPFPKYNYTMADSGCSRRYFSVAHDSAESFSYKWWIDGIPAGTAESWMHKFAKNGEYVVRLQITSSSGCNRTHYETVSITDVANYSAGPDTFVCKGDSLQLRASGGVKYVWRDRDSTVSDKTVSNPYARPYRFTRYYVDIMDSTGCWYTDSTSVNIFDFKVFLSTPATIFKEDPDSLKLRGVKMDGAKYIWRTKEGEILDTLHDYIHVKPPAKTVYYLTIIPYIGCPKTDSIMVSVDSIMADAGPSKSVCAGESIQLEASGGQYYEWDSAAGISNLNVSNPIVSPTSDQVYWVTVFKGGFSRRDSVFVKVNKIATAVISPVTICPGDSVQLHAFGGHVYSWSPNTFIDNPDKPKPLVYPEQITVYSVKITDTVTGCSAIEEIKVTVSEDCVRPGDANRDGIVNYIDLLHLGVGFGESGPRRSIVSSEWKGYPAIDWDEVLGQGINYKNFDFNGDGNINIDDTLAYKINYGKIFRQYTLIPYPTVSPEFAFRFEKDTFYAGDVVRADLLMGKPNPGFYGIGVQYYFFNNESIAPGTFKFSFLSRSGRSDLWSHAFTQAGSAEATIVGTNHKNEFKKGQIASVEFQLRDSSYFSSPGQNFVLGLDRALVIDSAGRLYEAAVTSTSTLVLRSRKPVSVNEISHLSEMISIYPNPAGSTVFLSSPGIDIKAVCISDILGREVYKIQNLRSNSLRINTAEIPDGIYLLHIDTEAGHVQRKLLIRK